MFEKEIALCKEISELSDALTELLDGFGVTASVRICDTDLSELKGFLGKDYYDSLHAQLTDFKRDVANSAREHIKNMIDKKLAELRGSTD